MKCAGTLAMTAMSLVSPSILNRTPKSLLRGVVFDLDGTLTVPNLDFGEMYRRCQVDPSTDILAEIDAMPSDRAAECRRIVEDMEEEGRRTLKLMPGAHEVFTWLSQHGIPTALVTRNTKSTVDRLEELLPHASFDIAIPRDYAAPSFPPKPHPATLQHITERWKVKDDPTTVVMVGDSPSNDILYGKAVGTTTALLDTGRRYSTTETSKSVEAQPDFIVQNLWQLPRFFWMHMEIPGPLGSNSPLLKYDTPVPSTEACHFASQGDLSSLRSMPKEALKTVCTKTGNTPLIWAADGGHVDAVHFILEQTHDESEYVNARGYLGATAVSRATCRGHAPCLRLLADAGADLDICNDKMQYPLHFAAFKEHMDCLHVLLEKNANTLVLDRKGRTPSLDTKNQEIRDILESAMNKAHAKSLVGCI